MLPLTKEQEAALGLELAGKAPGTRRPRRRHPYALTPPAIADQMLIQRLKKRKLALKDRIVQLENILLPDIIA